MYRFNVILRDLIILEKPGDLHEHLPRIQPIGKPRRNCIVVNFDTLSSYYKSVEGYASRVLDRW